MEGKAGVMPPFRGYMTVVSQELARLMESSKIDDAVGLVRAMRRQLEPREAATTFGMGQILRDGESLSDFLRSIIHNNDKAAALIACNFQAAARLPEVRTQPDRLSFQRYNGIKCQLFQEWENRGGWAAPVDVFDELIKGIARPGGLGSTRGLWLPLLHDILARMGPAEQRDLAKWAAKQKDPGISVVAAELTLAQSLLDATEPALTDPAGTRLPAKSPQAGKTFASAAASSAALLKDETIASHVRLSLAAFFTAAYPGLLNDETLQTWALAAAQAWHDGTPVSVFEMESLFGAASVLPINESWNQTCRLVLERWSQREQVIREKRMRYVESGFPPFILRFAARSGASNLVEPLLKQSYGYDTQRYVSILLECGDWQHAVDPRLSLSLSSLSSRANEPIGWLPASAETLKGMERYPIEDALLSEVIALNADDLATRFLYPHHQWPDRDRRFEDFVKKLPSTPKPSKPEKMALPLVALGLENTPAALDLLPQFDELAKGFTPDSLGGDQSRMHIWSDFLAIHAALNLARGDGTLADAYYERLKTDPEIQRRNSSNTLLSDFRHTLFFCLSQLWQAGEARDPAKISALALLKEPPSKNYDASHFSVQLITSALKSWQSALTAEPLPAEMTSDIKDNRIVLEVVTAIGGSGKSRLSFQQRLNLFTSLSGRSDLLNYSSQTWDNLVHRHYFTSEELLKEQAALMKAAPSLSPYHLNDLAEYMRRHNADETAAAAWAMAARQTPNPKEASYFFNRCLLDRAATLIHLKKINEAQKCLGELNEKYLPAYNRRLQAALLRLLAPPAPAPAK